jgi:hypothetical protein
VPRSCEQSIKPLSSINGNEYLYWLSNHQIKFVFHHSCGIDSTDFLTNNLYYTCYGIVIQIKLELKALFCPNTFRLV